MARKLSNRKTPTGIKLFEGTATYMGDSMFVIDTANETLRGPGRYNRVSLHMQDLEAILTFASAYGAMASALRKGEAHRPA